MVSTRRFFSVAFMGLNVVQTTALGLTSNGSSRAGATTATALDSFQWGFTGYWQYDYIEPATSVAAPSCESCAQRCLDFGDACIAFNTNGDCASAAQCNIYTTAYGKGTGTIASHCRGYVRRVFPTHIVMEGTWVPTVTNGNTEWNTISLGAYVGSHATQYMFAAPELLLDWDGRQGHTWPLLKFMGIPATCTSFTAATLRLFVTTQNGYPTTMYTLIKDWGIWDTHDFELGLPNSWTELGMDDATLGTDHRGLGPFICCDRCSHVHTWMDRN